MSLPSTLLEAIAAPEGGRVVLIIGAGCSLEPPTNIPLSSDCSNEAHRRLVLDGILSDGECHNPNDLSVLADTVKAKVGGQSELVRRLPIPPFKNATPNDGHLITTSLMLEGAITNVVTLNFDLALNHALSQLSVEDEVCIIRGPEEHDRLSRSNIIYLHRNVEADLEEWILTTEALEESWKGQWEEIITRFALAAPVTVFVGLGSPCGVIRHSVQKLKEARENQTNIYLASPGTLPDSHFATELRIDAAEYISSGWVDLMRALENRYILEITNRIVNACGDLTAQENWTTEDVTDLCQQLNGLGLIAFGRLRAFWLLIRRKYARIENSHIEFIADMLLWISMVKRTLNLSATLNPLGLVEFQSRSTSQIWSLRVVSGRGVFRWVSIEAEIRLQEKYEMTDSIRPRCRTIVVTNITGTPQVYTAPDSIIDTIDKEDIVEGDMDFQLFSADELRNDPEKIKEIFS